MISLETAQQIAQRALQERVASSPVFSRYIYEPVRFQEENDCFRVFSVFSAAAFNDGVMPPTLYVCVDNVDGHLLTAEEQEAFYSQSPLMAQVA